MMTNLGESVTAFFTRKKAVPEVPTHLHSATRFPYGPFQFKIQIAKGIKFDIWASPDLMNWNIIASDASVADTVDYVDSDASKFSHRYYRVIAEAVPSDNVIGFVTINIPPAFSMIANPVSAPNNAISALFPKMPDNTTINKFDTRMFKLTENTVKGGKWSSPTETLVPGEGAIFFNPTTDYKSLNLVGEVMQGNLFNSIPAGFSIRSSLVPQPGRLHTDLAFPAADGDVVHLFDRDRQQYVIFNYDPKSWNSNPPVVGVGESFWVGKTSPANWVRNFTVNIATSL